MLLLTLTLRYIHCTEFIQEAQLSQRNRAMLVEILSTAAQMYEKSQRLEAGE